MSRNPYLSVQALTKYIKRKFDADPHLRNVYVKGELSNVKIHSSGHIYFTLKDDTSRINCAMFRTQASKMKFRPENGMNVLLTGDVNVYEQTGQYQLYVQTMQPDGIGELYLAFEQLKEQLGKEGLFDSRWKKPLPRYPERVGVITAPTGAAIQDICTTLARRYPLAEVILYPAIVQGKVAAPSIAEAIRQASTDNAVDVLIVGRGGGSIEDLWAFNEEEVARAIFSCQIPTISAVGHETDTTIADFVADRRAPTPTAAAEMAVPSREELIKQLMDRKRSLYQSLSYKITSERKQLTRLETSYPLQYPERLYRPFTERLIHLESRLSRSGIETTTRFRTQFERLHGHLEANSPIKKVAEKRREASQITTRLERSAALILRQRKDGFVGVLRMLQALNPLQVMERGYSIVYENGKVVNSVSQLSTGQQIEITFEDGQAEAIVQSTRAIVREET